MSAVSLLFRSMSSRPIVSADRTTRQRDVHGWGVHHLLATSQSCCFRIFGLPPFACLPDFLNALGNGSSETDSVVQSTLILTEKAFPIRSRYRLHIRKHSFECFFHLIRQVAEHIVPRAFGNFVTILIGKVSFSNVAGWIFTSFVRIRRLSRMQDHEYERSYRKVLMFFRSQRVGQIRFEKMKLWGKEGCNAYRARVSIDLIAVAVDQEHFAFALYEDVGRVDVTDQHVQAMQVIDGFDHFGRELRQMQTGPVWIVGAHERRDEHRAPELLTVRHRHEVAYDLVMFVMGERSRPTDRPMRDPSLDHEIEFINYVFADSAGTIHLAGEAVFGHIDSAFATSPELRGQAPISAVGVPYRASVLWDRRRFDRSIVDLCGSGSLP